MGQIDAFFKVSYGMYLISCSYNEQSNAYIANTAFQVSATPPKFAITCHKENFSAPLILGGKSFNISVLQQDTPLSFIQKFGYQSGKNEKKFTQLNYKKGVTGVPVVYDYSVAWFECQLENTVDVGTHWLFIGSLVDFGLLSHDDEPLDYAWYRKHHKAASPPKAPTYVAQERDEIPTAIPAPTKAYLCPICDYTYYTHKGDPAGGIAPGTPFEELPHDWVCPVCGAGKMLFYETTPR